MLMWLYLAGFVLLLLFVGFIEGREDDIENRGVFLTFGVILAAIWPLVALITTFGLAIYSIIWVGIYIGKLCSK